MKNSFPVWNVLHSPSAQTSSSRRIACWKAMPNSSADRMRQRYSKTLGYPKGNIVFATSIENIVGGTGENIITLHGDAELKGVVAASGKVTLRYDQYDPLNDADTAHDGVVVDGTAGIGFTIPGFTIPYLATVQDTHYIYGSATGIQGNRLIGISDILNLTISPGSELLPANNAVAGFDNVYGSTGDDDADSATRRTTTSWSDRGWCRPRRRRRPARARQRIRGIANRKLRAAQERRRRQDQCRRTARQLHHRSECRNRKTWLDRCRD